MDLITSFAVVNVNGNDRISYTYDTIDGETGMLVKGNNSSTFFVVDDDLRRHVEAIRSYIRDNKLSQ